MFQQSLLIFSLVSLIFFYWGKIVYKNGIKKIYFFYYLLNFLLFYGPIFYYRLGFTGYSNALSVNSLNTFSYIAFFVAFLNILFFKILNKKKSFFKIKPFLIKYKYGLLINKNLKYYYLFFILFVASYLIVFFKYFPLVNLIFQGKIGARLDTTGATPFYITFSAISMIFVPSAFFYFKNVLKSKLTIFLLFAFTVFVLTAGGNKGIVSFFLIFYAIISVKKIKVVNLTLVFLSLFVIYAITKGITTFNSETIDYLIESPFRRLFAAQGAGFVARIEMLDQGYSFLNSSFLIKQQVFSEMHVVPLGTGTAPTHFIGDIFVKQGYVIMWFVYFFYLMFFIPIMLLVDKFIEGDKYAHVLWNFFILIFLNTMTEVNVANLLRFALIFLNLIFINVMPRINMKYKSVA